jgi:hypothetical protein
MNGIQVNWKKIPLLRPESNWHARLVTIMYDVVKSWDFTNGQLDDDATFSDTCQSLTFDDANNGHFFTPPATLPHGEYILQLIDAATPAVTDQPVCKLIRWNAEMVTWIGDL